MLQRFHAAVANSTERYFHGLRRKPPADLLYTEFVLSYLELERFNVE